MSMASHSVPGIRLISSSICRAMPGFCLLWRLVFDLFPFYFNSHLMPWCHRRKEINHRHYLIIISPSAYFCLPKIFAVIPRSECCDPVLKENLRWELISYSELLWNLELTPPSNLLSDSKSSVTKTVDIFLQCIWSAPLVTKCPEEKLRFPIGNMSTL